MCVFNLYVFNSTVYFSFCICDSRHGAEGSSHWRRRHRYNICLRHSRKPRRRSGDRFFRKLVSPDTTGDGSAGYWCPYLLGTYLRRYSGE
ncbi:hypothetical protein CEXT_358171 [Caerostris extrusa]|uniref:Secreted protein n=1 Tax=Caerostris extrusa TaxID=172846 RepID=A0AAV4XWC0_CAEEX|nr:hypothetical protein CEXT_358171 [Caerostris extrusa]